MKKDYSEFHPVIDRLRNVIDCGSYLKACCPAHQDDKQSLSITIGDTGHLIMKCHAGCSFTEVQEALGVSKSAFFKKDKSVSPYQKKPKNVQCVYPYNDAQGNVVFEVVRMQPKDFRQRRPARPDDPSSKIKNGYVWSVSGVQKVLYRLDGLTTALMENPNRYVFVVEGEKDADLLWSHGFLATTNAGGAGKWLPEYSETLRGRNVVIIPDCDPVNPKTGRSAGEEHAKLVASSLDGIAAKCSIIRLPLREGQDVYDWFQAGGTPEALKQIVSENTANHTGEHSVQLESKPEPLEMLSVKDIMAASSYACERRANFLIQHEKGKGRKPLGWEYAIENSCAEIAVAKHLGKYWQSKIHNSIPLDVHVRKDASSDFSVRTYEGHNSVLVLVVGECPCYSVLGCITSSDARAIGGGSDTVIVPKDALRPLEDFFVRVHVR